jgi:trk system potassium uptake protein TrkA
MLLGAGESIAFELTVPQTSRAAGKEVSKIATDPAFPSTCVLAGMFEASGKVQAPRGSSVVTGGMVLLLVASRAQMSDVIEFFLANGDGSTLSEGDG